MALGTFSEEAVRALDFISLVERITESGARPAALAWASWLLSLGCYHGVSTN